MKKYLSVFAAILFCYNLSAQFGARISTQKNDFKNWNTIVQSSTQPANSNLFAYSYDIGIDYWFRLKNTRLEFYPEVGLGFARSSNSTAGNDAFPNSYKFNKIYAGLNTQLYFLDLKNDCQCPTFSKQNDFFKKGLFLLIAGKANLQNKETVYSSETRRHNDITAEISGGLGLDIGISDLLTISPFATVVYYPSSEWSGISINHGIVNVLPPDETTSNLAYKIGIRVGFRPDYLKNR